MAEPLRHRQTKGAETDMPSLPPPRHIPTLPGEAIRGSVETIESALDPSERLTSTLSGHSVWPMKSRLLQRPDFQDGAYAAVKAVQSLTQNYKIRNSQHRKRSVTTGGRASAEQRALLTARRSCLTGRLAQAARAGLAGCQFQGSSSATRLAGWSAMRRRTSAR